MVKALMDTGAEVSLIYGNPKRFKDQAVVVGFNTPVSNKSLIDNDISSCPPGIQYCYKETDFVAGGISTGGIFAFPTRIDLLLRYGLVPN